MIHVGGQPCSSADGKVVWQAWKDTCGLVGSTLPPRGGALVRHVGRQLHRTGSRHIPVDALAPFCRQVHGRGNVLPAETCGRHAYALVGMLAVEVRGAVAGGPWVLGSRGDGIVVARGGKGWRAEPHGWQRMHRAD